jgi:multicomponent K+:H+ antiporter subunit A
MTLLALVLLPLAGSLVTALLPTRKRTLLATWAGAVSLAAAVWVGSLSTLVNDGGVHRERQPWIPSLGLDLVFQVDGISWMFAMLVTGIGALVVLYARYYMSPEDPVARFYSAFLAFMGAMLGVVLSGNLVQLVVFWELTSLFSFLLIGYWYHREDARRGAQMALAVTGAGGLALLGGVTILGHIVGSNNLEVVLASGDAVRGHPLYPAALLLILLGVFTKSAQFPFHFWLPRAMTAPTPASAYLHSATMVKAGTFLLARLWPVLSGTELWFALVSGAGAATLLLGAYVAMFQTDLKKLLAYSTISHLGLITLLFGLNSPLAAVAGVFHIMNHATFKASLFMAVGIIDHETGTRDTRRLRGLRRAMPITAALAVVASGAMAGVPLLNGFLSKEMFFAETVFIASRPWVNIALPVLATLAGAFAVVYSLRFGYDTFFGPPPGDLPREPEEAPLWMRVPIDVLVLLCLIVGVAPALSVGPFLAAAARPVVGGELPEYSLAVWHGINAPLVMSIIAVAGGVVGHRLLRRRQLIGQLLETPLIARFDGKRLFERTMLGFTRAAHAGVHLLGTSRLQSQVFLVIGVTVLLAIVASLSSPFAPGDRPRLPASPAFALLWLIGMVCAVGVAVQAKFHRMVALTLLGGAGLVTSLTFVWFSAPDLALTQLVVEVVTTILFLLGLRWLPMRRQDVVPPLTWRDHGRRARDLALAAGAGSGLALLSYALLTRPAPAGIAPFFLSHALPEGGGTNVVNVMLVDFRAFDTLGEITVLAAVALTVYALLRRFRPAEESIDPPRQQRVLPHDVVTDLVSPRSAKDEERGYLMVPSVIARLLYPVAIVVALHLLLRGHNLPGGGFVAGLTIAIVFLTQYLVAGTEWVEARSRLRPVRWIAVGALVATASGLGSLLLGYPFLTTHTAHVTLPLFGEVHVPSAMVFDLGIFAVVVGATLLMQVALAHQSIRAHRRPSGDAAVAERPALPGGTS